MMKFSIFMDFSVFFDVKSMITCVLGLKIGVIFDMVGPYYSYAGNLMEDGHRKRVLSSIYM